MRPAFSQQFPKLVSMSAVGWNIIHWSSWDFPIETDRQHNCYLGFACEWRFSGHRFLSIKFNKLG
jgi:hypothetical protein